MPRTATLTESGNKNTVWYKRTINGVNKNVLSTKNISDLTQQHDLNTISPIGVIQRVKTIVDWRAYSYRSRDKAYQSLVIGGDTYIIAGFTPNTSYRTYTMDSGNFKATKRYTQANLDAMYFQERLDKNYIVSNYCLTQNRTHTVEYCYEHMMGGLSPMKFSKIGGLDITKVWKIGGRSQISGDGDVAA